MSAELGYPASRVTQALPLARWAGLFALLVGEVTLLTLRFDVGTLDGKTGAWAALLRPSPLLLRLAVAVAAATLLLSGKTFWEAIRQDTACGAGASPWWPFLVGHLVLVVAFAGLTGLLLEGDIGSRAYPLVPALLWWLLGAGTLGLWGLALLPGRLWVRLARRCWPGLLAGLVVGLAAWGGGLLLTRLWEPLGRATLWVVHGLLSGIYPGAFYRPDTLEVGTPAFSVEIAPQCSGYEGVGLIWAFLAAYVYFFRHRLRFPQVLLLFPVGTALMWFANAVRIAALIALGTGGWGRVAMGGFHSQAGWLAFNAVALGLVAVTGRLPFFAAGRPERQGAREGSPAGPYVGPFLVLMVLTMVTGAVSAGFDWLYPLRVVCLAGVLCFFRKSYAGLLGSWSWAAVGLGLGTCILWVAVTAAGGGAGVSPPPGWRELPPGWAAAWLAFRVVGYVVIVPVVEELAFRGYLTRRLIAADFSQVPLGRFTWLSFLGSSLAFGVLHGRYWLPGTLAGMVFALALYRRGRLADAVVAHAVANAALAAYVLLTGQWALWS